MAHVRRRTGFVLIVLLLNKICKLLVAYRDYQSTIQTSEAMAAWDGLYTACQLFIELVADPRVIPEA